MLWDEPNSDLRFNMARSLYLVIPSNLVQKESVKASVVSQSPQPRTALHPASATSPGLESAPTCPFHSTAAIASSHGTSPPSPTHHQHAPRSQRKKKSIAKMIYFPTTPFPSLKCHVNEQQTKEKKKKSTWKLLPLRPLPKRKLQGKGPDIAPLPNARYVWNKRKDAEKFYSK